MNKTIVVILRNLVPVAYANSEHEAKQLIMNKMEKHPEFFSSVEGWWKSGPHNASQIYSFKEIPNVL